MEIVETYPYLQLVILDWIALVGWEIVETYPDLSSERPTPPFSELGFVEPTHAPKMPICITSFPPLGRAVLYAPTPGSAAHPGNHESENPMGE